MPASSTTWGDIRDEFRDTFRDTTQAFIDNDELARMARRILRLINSKQVYAFQETQGTLSATGATSYDLNTLFPGYKELLTVQWNNASVNPKDELYYVNTKDFDLISDAFAYTVFNNATLRLTAPGAQSLSGSLNVIYFSNYMVYQNGGATLIEYPTAADDKFSIPERFMSVLTEGLNMLGFRKDRAHREDYIDSKAAFEEALQQLMMEEPKKVEHKLRFARSGF